MYNLNSSKEYNWFPDWFDCFDFGEELTDSIKRFQKKIGIKPDGLCGPVTIKSKYTERLKTLEIGNNIIFGGNLIPVDWKKFKSFVDTPKWRATKLSDRIGKPKRKIKLMVTHWDAALSSSSCYTILEKRGLSCHFLIDNDGTIIQTCDIQNVAYHAGNSNPTSIGVEVSNAYYLKYQSKYEKIGYGPRPVVRSTVHGKQLPPHLGFYDVQIEALEKLFKSIHTLGIPLETPSVETIFKPAIRGEWSGFCHHYHLSSKKIDSSGAVDLKKLLQNI